MKQNVSPVVAVIAAVVVFALVGFFMWQRSTGTGLTKEQEKKFLTPLQMPGPGQAGKSLVPPPPTGAGGMPEMRGGLPVPPPPSTGR